MAGLAASNGMLEEAYVYDTYGEATIYGGPEPDGRWPIGDVDRDSYTKTRPRESGKIMSDKSRQAGGKGKKGVKSKKGMKGNKRL